MPHQVLQRLRVHAGFRHVAAVGVAADMRRDVRHLHPVDIVIPLYHVVEPVFPVHRHQRVAVLIQKQESRVPVYHPFIPWRLPVLDDALEAPRHIIRHGYFPCACIGLGRFHDQLHVGSPLELVVYVQYLILKVNIPQRQPAELRYAQAGMEKYLPAGTS